MKQIVKNFNNLIKNIIFKVKNKTNNKLSISKFNRYLITFISLLFLYLFYLLIPILYDKNWVQKNIEDQLLNNFNINFSLSSDISYRILPSPHYFVKDSKIFKKNNKTVSLAEIKNLKVFVSQKNFFDKKKLILKDIKINNADFTLSTDDIKFLKNSTNNKFSNKKIEIKKSNMFFKNDLNEVVSIIKISNAFLLQDKKNFLNIFKLKGKIFNIPFNIDYSRKLDFSKSEKINITAKTLKLNMSNTLHLMENDSSKGKNIISFLNSRINTTYKIENGAIIFNSVNSRIMNNNLDYSGELLIDPLNLNLNIDLDSYDLHNALNNDSILNELIKTKLLFNNNISMNTVITTNVNLKNKIFQNAVIYFNIIHGKLNINKTKLINNKIGILELENSDLSYEKDRLILNTDIVVNIKNSDELFSFLQTNKKFRKPIKSILVNLNYDFLSKEINFNNIKINNQEINDDLYRVIEGFNENALNNLNKSKRLLNNFFKIYEG